MLLSHSCDCTEEHLWNLRSTFLQMLYTLYLYGWSNANYCHFCFATKLNPIWYQISFEIHSASQPLKTFVCLVSTNGYDLVISDSLLFFSLKDSVFRRIISAGKTGQRVVLQTMWDQRAEPPVSLCQCLPICWEQVPTFKWWEVCLERWSRLSNLSSWLSVGKMGERKAIWRTETLRTRGCCHSFIKHLLGILCEVLKSWQVFTPI